MKHRTSSPHEAPPESPSLFLDREGRWFHEGVEITHPRTRKLFSRNISRGDDQRYYVHVGREYAVVEVEDTPFLVVSVTVQEQAGDRGCTYQVLLNDGSEECLDPRTLSIEQDHVMYGRVKGATEKARFVRSAYYQICARIEYAEQEDRYVLPWKGTYIPIQQVGVSHSSGS